MATVESTGWERIGNALVAWCGYVTLAVSTALSMVAPSWLSSDPIGTLSLVAISVGWVYAMFSRTPMPKTAHPVRMAVFFVGLLILASALMLRETLFFVFMISGFFYASVLRPFVVLVLGVGATSLLINTLVAGFPQTPEGWAFYLAIIVIQTAVIGFATVVGEKLSEQSEGRRETVARLEAALEENAGLHAQLLTQAREAGVLDERGRMAREIHDTIAHGLTAIVTQLEAAGHATDRPADQQRHIDNALRIARDSLTEARRSVEASRPEPLEAASLPDALDRVATDWSAINGIAVQVTITGEPIPLHPEIEVALLRTAQEALANVARHAHATRAGITLSFMGDVVTLDVRDDGVGFEVPAGGEGRTGGFGLTAMRQRISRVAGTLAIESEPGGGTAISARVPAIAAKSPATGA
jgi:signal transduction histidine kinase